MPLLVTNRSPPPVCLFPFQVSLAIRLAVGITEAQAAAGTDKLLASWLAQPKNIRSAIAVSGVPDPIGPNALIRWLLAPEIWVAPVGLWVELWRGGGVFGHSLFTCMHGREGNTQRGVQFQGCQTQSDRMHLFNGCLHVKSGLRR